MTVSEQIRIVCVLGPIAALLLLGLSITLRSGVANLGTCQGARQLAQNFSRTIAMLTACVVALLIVQQFIGYRMSLNW